MGGRYCRAASYCQRPYCAKIDEPCEGLKRWATKAKGFRMSEDSRKNMSREERLAAKLRENLRRRKAQARAAADRGSDSDTTQPLPFPPGEG